MEREGGEEGEGGMASDVQNPVYPSHSGRREGRLRVNLSLSLSLSVARETLIEIQPPQLHVSNRFTAKKVFHNFMDISQFL